jgi:phospho-N-acetylmuramoyl-pentapeptide-transferase
MFYHLLYPLHEHFIIFNVFKYITFRSAYAAATALAVSFLLGPYVIRRLAEFRVKQAIRADGPATHLDKEGTPTMGGLLIVAAIVIPTLLWGNLANRYVLLVLLSTVWLAAVGFLDDYLLVIKRLPNGLRGRYKLISQFLLGLAIGLVVYYLPPETGLSRTETNIPFMKDAFLDFRYGFLYVPFVALVVTGASNAVNLSDGLDGLVSGMMCMAAIAFAGLSYISGHVKFSEYLNIPYLAGSGELTVFCMAIFGASLGFLWFNCHPAQVFMGDTGALALGGTLGTVAVLIKREFLLVVVCGIFVAEALSVIIQVISYRTRHKRVFKMAPIHHHFELSGWPESKVVVRFWIIAALLGLLSLSTIKLQ